MGAAQTGGQLGSVLVPCPPWCSAVGRGREQGLESPNKIAPNGLQPPYLPFLCSWDNQGPGRHSPASRLQFFKQGDPRALARSAPFPERPPLSHSLLPSATSWGDFLTQGGAPSTLSSPRVAFCISQISIIKYVIYLCNVKHFNLRKIMLCVWNFQ